MFSSKRTRNAMAVVTGAGSGIGRAFATEIAARGGRVVCADINGDTARDTAELIKSGGGKATSVICDVADFAAVENLAAEAQRWFGEAPSLIVNNAGVGVGGLNIGELPIEDWRWTVGINMWGVINGCHVFVPKLRERGNGGVINVCSTASFSAAPQMGPYNTTKAAVLALSETLAAELSGTNIAVTALCPTFVKTNIVRDGRIAASSSALAQKLMNRTGLTPERVARETLDACDRNKLYVLPQFDARMIWRAKRLSPANYARGAGLIGRLSARFQ